MSEPANEDSAPPSEGGMPQTVPDPATLYRDADTRAMLHEMQGTLGSLIETTRALDARRDLDSRKLDGLARDNQDMIDRLKELGPKLDDVIGFIKHGMPSVASKADIESLRADLSHRPTRRQSIEDILKFGGLVAAILGLLSYLSRAH